MIKVVCWNIAKKKDPWHCLAKMAEQGEADVALLQEAGHVPGNLIEKLEVDDKLFWHPMGFDRLLAVKFSLDWKFEGPSAAYLLALDKGYFADEGLDVTIDTGQGSLEAIPRVASGVYQFGFADINSLIKFGDKNPEVGEPFAKFPRQRELETGQADRG